MMTTLLRRHPEQYLQKNRFYFGIYSTFVLSDHLIHIVTKLTPGLCELDLGISESFLRKLELGRGDACFGDDDDDIVSRTPPNNYARAHTTHYFKSTPSYAEVRALGVLASPFHVQLALFLMFIRCCASGFRSVKTFLAAPAFCTVFTAFSYYPTTCGLAVSFLSSLKYKCGGCVLPNNSVSLNDTPSPHFHTSTKRRKKNASFNPNTILRGPELVPEKAFSTTTVQCIQVRNLTA